MLQRREWHILSDDALRFNKAKLNRLSSSLLEYAIQSRAFPCEPEDCQHWSLQSMRREAWLTEDDTLRLLTARDQSSISIPRWLLWCFLSCFPERPQNAGDWPDCWEDGQQVHIHTHTHTETETQKMQSQWITEWLTGLVDSAKGMSGVVFAGLEAVFTEVEVVAVSAFEPGAVYREHLAAIAPEDNTSSYMSIILRCIENWPDRNLKHIHTSLQGEHWGPIPFQTTNQSSGTAGGSLRLHLFHWHWKLKQNIWHH